MTEARIPTQGARRLLLPTREAATVLGVAPATIRDWRRQGLVEPRQDGGRPRWDLVDLRRAQRLPRQRDPRARQEEPRT